MAAPTVIREKSSLLTVTNATAPRLHEAAEVYDQVIEAAVDAVPADVATGAYALAKSRTRDVVLSSDLS